MVVKISYNEVTIDQDWKPSRRNDPSFYNVSVTLDRTEEQNEKFFDIIYNILNSTFFNYYFWGRQYDIVPLLFNSLVLNFSIEKIKKLFQGDSSLLDDMKKEPCYKEIYWEVAITIKKEKELEDLFKKLKEELKEYDPLKDFSENIPEYFENNPSLLNEIKLKLKENSFFPNDILEYIFFKVTERDDENEQEKTESELRKNNIDITILEILSFFKNWILQGKTSKKNLNTDYLLSSTLNEDNNNKLCYIFTTNSEEEIYTKGEINILF